jgi:hypothetical protein
LESRIDCGQQLGELDRAANCANGPLISTRAIELQSKTMVTAEEHEEIRFLLRPFRLYSLAKQKAQDRANAGQDRIAISGPRT